jgi:hypothetical protein
MRAGQRPAAYLGVAGKAARCHHVQVDRAFHVAELPHVVVMPVIAGPAEEHVAGGLHEPLTHDHPLPLVPELGLAGIRGKHGLHRLLELQEDGGAGIGVREQAQVAASADAADTHHLPGRIEDLVALEQGPGRCSSSRSGRRAGRCTPRSWRYRTRSPCPYGPDRYADSARAAAGAPRLASGRRRRRSY